MTQDLQTTPISTLSTDSVHSVVDLTMEIDKGKAKEMTEQGQSDKDVMIVENEAVENGKIQTNS